MYVVVLVIVTTPDPLSAVAPEDPTPCTVLISENPRVSVVYPVDGELIQHKIRSTEPLVAVSLTT